jgi:peptide/nickel transport system substrate-binding protein
MKKIIRRGYRATFLVWLNLHANIAAAEPKTISLAWETSPRTIDPRFASDADSQYLENLVHCSIASFGENGQTVSDLAKGWRWNDTTTLEVELRPEAKFSDGNPVTPADVVATYQFFLRKDVTPPSPRAGAFAAIASVEQKVGNKVVFKLTEADASFITNLVVGILPAKDAAGSMIANDKSVIGCGPFMLKSFDMTGIELVANKHYSLGKVIKSEGVVIKIVKDETTRLAKLKKGEVNLVQNLLSRDKVADPALTRRTSALI